MNPFPSSFALVCCLAASSLAQDDLRDQITRSDGKVLSGRVYNPYAAGEIVLLQGGRRVRVPRADITAMDLVADRVREFCERRVRLHDSVKAQRFLVDWARSKDLPGLAHLQALWLVLEDDGNAEAHEFLGHKKGPKGWLWVHDGRTMTREQLDVALAKSPMQLAGERFMLRCDADLRTNVAALFDLEQLGVIWFQRFGAALQLHEVLEPMQIVADRNADDFPKWGFRPLPYYEPSPHGDVGRTFYAGAAPVRPEKLFFVGTQALLYHTLIGELDRRDDRDRVCAWLEIGLGMHMQQTMDGPPGFAVQGPLRAQDLQAITALGRGYRLTHLLHLPMYSGFYLMDDTATAINWSAATMFVAWLLDEKNPLKTREKFLAFVRESLGERKGDSSSAFDKAMGTRVEELDEPWREWLTKVAGY
ncbi:MAG TPA: hypothetical protein VFZ65_15020 [Planctomycetota bacterium]|nr:hypothetical protein [Planctomycetota bacterium]